MTGAPAASTLGWASWAVFEWARNPYVILITIYVFAPYFSTQVVGDPVRGQALLGDANKYAGMMIALLAPLAGAIADRSGRRKPWIACFVVLMVPAMAALWFALPAGEGIGVVPTLVCIVVIAMCFEFGAVFHNAMLPHVAPATKIGFISGLAISLGNLAGLLLMVSVLYLLALPGTVDWSWVPAEAYFGIDQSRFEDARIVGPLTAIWLLLFALPLLLFTPDGAEGVGIRSAIREGLAEVRATLRELPHYRNIAAYLMARMIYNDGLVGILIFGGVYAAGIFGWGTVHMLLFGILMSAAAALGGYLGGWLDDRLGSKRTILVAVGGTYNPALGSVIEVSLPDKARALLDSPGVDATLSGIALAPQRLAAYRTWLNDVLTDDHSRGRTFTVGFMAEAEMVFVAQQGLQTGSGAVVLEDRLIVGKKADRIARSGRELSATEWSSVPEIITNPGAVLWSPDQQRIIYVASASADASARIVVAPGFSHDRLGGRRVESIRSAQKIATEDLRGNLRGGQLQLLRGSLDER